MSKEVLMPSLSPTMQSGNLAKWLVKEGQEVQSGDVIAEVETDKSVMELESAYSGSIYKLLVPDNTRDIAINEVIAIILEEGESTADVVLPVVSRAKGDKGDNSSLAGDTSQPIVHSVASPSIEKKPDARLKASPVARKLASGGSVDLCGIKGTGPGNRIIKNDVLMAMESVGNSVAAGIAKDDGVRFEVSNMRRIIASRLLESKTTIPHFYLEIECAIDDLLRLRENINSSKHSALPGGEPVKVTINDFIVKAVSLAIKKNPGINVSWASGGALIKYSNVNVCVAVAIDDGLVTPVIRCADKLSLLEISGSVKALAAKARSGKIMPEDLQGGTFTISNLGMYGIPKFSAIINPPQSAIMAVGCGVEKPVIVNGGVSVATVMSVVLSVDHRAIDGALGAQFLASFKRYIEQPLLMFIE